ncbi:MAG: tetratricopeptide repeat protein, partial [Planctomycetota bacterium]|nr:tetratricopeptide repeat protein [Planctomycetota bacterium]
PDFEKDKNKCLPSTLLISKEGKIVMWDEGYNMAIGSLIESACGLLLGGEKASPLIQSEAKISYQPFTVGPDYAGEGDLYLKAGNYAKAVESFLKALKDNPDDAGVWYNLACICSLMGKVDEGLEALKKAIQYGWKEFHWMDNDPDLQNLRNDPRYKEIRK